MIVHYSSLLGNQEAECSNMTQCWVGEEVRGMTVTCSSMVCLAPRETRVMLACLVIMDTKEIMEPRESEVMRVRQE